MITMSDIARKAKVSRSTVSFVLNRRETAVRISDETSRKVWQAAQDLGYRPNAIARAMVTGNNPVIGFLVCLPELENVARMLAGALDEAEEQRYSIKVLRLRNNQLDHRTIERCAELRLAGAVALFLTEPMLEYLHQEMTRYRIPVASLDDSFPHPWGVRVISDDLDGCRQAMAHLEALGHRRIALMAGRPDAGASALREQGYREAMARRGLPIPDGYVAYGRWLSEPTEDATRAMLADSATRPSAILCAGDQMAMVVMRTAAELGLRVPQDLSVIGFGDLSMAELATPALTTVAQPWNELGGAVVRHLLARIQANSGTSDRFEDGPQEDILPTRLVVRKSTGPAPM